MGGTTVAMMIAGGFVALFWVYQFVQLMLLADSDFPGRYDKILWGAAFVFAFPVTPFAFLWWKTAFRAMRQEQASS
jgi:hypothetical protein